MQCSEAFTILKGALDHFVSQVSSEKLLSHAGVEYRKLNAALYAGLAVTLTNDLTSLLTNAAHLTTIRNIF